MERTIDLECLEVVSFCSEYPFDTLCMILLVPGVTTALSTLRVPLSLVIASRLAYQNLKVPAQVFR